MATSIPGSATATDAAKVHLRPPTRKLAVEFIGTFFLVLTVGASVRTGSSPWSAAVSSLFAFALGAVVVVLPYLFGSGLAALIPVIAVAGLPLFVVGAAIGSLNGRGALRAGTRQLLIGGTAALLVFGIGHLMGASAGGRL